MSKRILLAILLVAFVAMPAFASVQNIKISGSIDSSYLYRENFDFGLTQHEDESQNIFFTQAILQVESDLTDQVSTTLALINERAWDTDGAGAESVDVNLAYVTMREMLYSPLTVVVGRQPLGYGNYFIIGPGGNKQVDSTLTEATDLSKQSAYDAIRMIFDYNPLTLELVYSMLDENDATLLDEQDDDVELYGINATYELGDDFNTMVEAYFFAKIDKSTADDSVAGTAFASSKNDTIYLPGFRVSTNPIEGLNVQGELAWQGGTKVLTTARRDCDVVQRDAMAAQFLSSYQLPVLEDYNPLLAYSFTWASGDKNADDLPYEWTATGVGSAGRPASSDEYTAWDWMYEGQGTGTIRNAILPMTNCQVHTVSLQANPFEDITTMVSWTGLWLDKELEETDDLPLAQPDSGGNAAVVGALDENHLGTEVDFVTTYDYTEDVQIGANFGWFMPGDAFAGDQDAASQAIVNVNVNF